MYFKMAPKDPPAKPLPQMPTQPEMSIGDEQGADPSMGAEPEPDPNDPNEGMEQEGPESPGSIDPSIAGYMGPEYGPFQCQHCVHFLQPNACQVVAGDIDPEGCCNIFTPSSDNEQAEPQGQPESPEPQEGEY